MNNEREDVNKKNKMEYEKIIEESKRKNDQYHDINNKTTRLILLILLLISIFGSIFYIVTWIIKSIL